MGTSPTARTLQRLKKDGVLAGVVERYNQYSRKTNDLFGFIDIVALDGNTVIGLQVTSGSNVSARVHKIKEECAQNAKDWLKCGAKIEVWGWRKLKVKRGGKAVRWEPVIVEITLEDLET